MFPYMFGPAQIWRGAAWPKLPCSARCSRHLFGESDEATLLVATWWRRCDIYRTYGETEFAEQVVPTVVFWNDVQGVADVAVVMAADGVVFMNWYLSAEPALLVEIVDSLVFLDSAFG